MSFELILSCLVYAVIALFIATTIKHPKFKIPILQNISILIGSLLACLLILELILATGALDSNHVWTPEIYKKLNKGINAKNYQLASQHPFRFNDLPHAQKKAPGITRIAVLGDSFIWGDGLHREEVWSRQFEQMFKKDSPNVEVLHWGRNGWSTINQHNFIKNYGHKYDLDLLIVGFVENDLDLYSFKQEPSTWQESLVLAPLGRIFPDSTNFISALLNAFFFSNNSAWYDKLYSKENITEYKKVLQKFVKLCKAKNIPVIFVMTPISTRKESGERFAKVVPLFEELGIKYLNLYPATAQAFNDRDPNTLKANRANAHPGPEMCALFAREVYKLLGTPTSGLKSS